MKRKEILRKIRAYNLMYWADKIGRIPLASKADDPTANHLNQLLGKHGSFGPDVADKYEEILGLPPMWLDWPHFNLWKSDQVEELSFLLPGEESVTRASTHLDDRQLLILAEQLKQLLLVDSTRS